MISNGGLYVFVEIDPSGRVIVSVCSLIGCSLIKLFQLAEALHLLIAIPIRPAREVIVRAAPLLSMQRPIIPPINNGMLV